MFLGILGLPAAVRGQQDTLITGTVTDTTGAVLPGVTVTATLVASGNIFIGVSDGSGQFRVGPLRPGVYRVTAELGGFNTVTTENLELLLGQRANTNFKMSIATLAETVTVSGVTPLVDVTESKLGGNIDTRQMQELPLNGRNWLDLSMLAPGNKANAVTEGPAGSANTAQFQINIDGQQVTQMVEGSFGQVRVSRDAVAEFELITNRFDATQGHSMGVQVNAITKSGTNRYAGSASGYFRDSKFIAKDFITNTVVPYQDQQISLTFGGPIRKDRIHFFMNYEYEREPQAFTFTSGFKRFDSIGPLQDARIENKGVVRLDTQFSAATRLMFRGSRYINKLPYDPRNTGGATMHPSAAAKTDRNSDQLFLNLTQVLRPTLINELKGGFSSFVFESDGVVPNSPRISLRSYTLGKPNNYYQQIIEPRYTIRDDLTMIRSWRGRHEVKLGGEYTYNKHRPIWHQTKDGNLDATGGPIPANVEDIFPVWNDFTTWKLGLLSPIAVKWTQAFGEFSFYDIKHIYSGWAQDNWTLTPRVTINLGLRYDQSRGAIAENQVFKPFLPELRPSEKWDFQPRFGFGYQLNSKTVIRGGWGKYVAELGDAVNYSTSISRVTSIPSIQNDKRPNFAADPFNLAGGGRTPTLAEIRSSGVRQDTTSSIASPDFRISYSNQASVGFQRQIGETMAIEADYAYVATRAAQNSRNINIAYNAATGTPYPFADLTKRPFPEWGNVSMRFSDGQSNDHNLSTSFTKRFSHRWQAQITYLLSGTWNYDNLPLNPGCQYPVVAPGNCSVAFQLKADLPQGDWNLSGAQRHRLVFNGIWQVVGGLQLSGLYFFGENGTSTTTSGVDVYGTQGAPTTRLRPNGTIIERNNFDRDPIHRVDMRLQQRIKLGRMSVDGILEVFNVFNHANYNSYVTNESSRTFGQPQQDVNVAYQPRTMQLGFRFAF